MVGFSESLTLTSINLPACLTGGSLANTGAVPQTAPCSQEERARDGSSDNHGDVFAVLSMRTTL